MKITKLLEKPAKSGTIGYVLKSGMPPQTRIKQLNGSLVIGAVVLSLIIGFFAGHI